MIHTAKQLKDKVKNMSGGNSEVAQALIRTYFMERFLERVSVSEYRNNFILKGGMLVASIVGVDMRATMDIDTTVKALPLNEKDARAIIERIGELQLEDGVNFKITSVKEIMEEFDYPGIRMMIEANLERMRQPFKIDISTCMKRETSFGEEKVRETLDKIKDDSGLEEMWNRFKRVNYFVDDLSWGEVSETIVDKIEKIAVS